jgi:hypothetical protein
MFPSSQATSGTEPARSLAAMLADQALEQVARQLIGSAGDQRGRAAQLFALLPLEHLEQHPDLLEDAVRRSGLPPRAGDTGLTVGEDGIELSFLVGRLGDLADDSPDSLMGWTAPEGAAAVGLLTETTLSRYASGRSLNDRSDHGEELERVESRALVLVTRTGTIALALTERDGPTICEVIHAFDEDRLVELGGRIPALLRRSVGLPVSAPSNTPWKDLLDGWAGRVRDRWDELAEQHPDPDQLGLVLLRSRPDVSIYERTVVLDQIAQIAAEEGIVPAGHDPIEWLLSDEHLEHLEQLEQLGEKDPRLAERFATARGPMEEVLDEQATGAGPWRTELAALLCEVGEKVAAAGRPVLELAARHQLVSESSEENRQRLRETPPGWWDLGSLLWSCALSGREGSLEALTDDQRLPMWLRAEGIRLLRFVREELEPSAADLPDEAYPEAV